MQTNQLGDVRSDVRVDGGGRSWADLGVSWRDASPGVVDPLGLLAGCFSLRSGCKRLFCDCNAFDLQPQFDDPEPGTFGIASYWVMAKMKVFRFDRHSCRI